VARFPAPTCQRCPVRAQCTSSTRTGRQLMLRPREIQWGSNIGFWTWSAGYGCPFRSRCDLILAGEPVEDRSTANLVVGQVITCGGLVSVWAGVSCASVWCGRAALKWWR
jgi:hypothetical protein